MSLSPAGGQLGCRGDIAHRARPYDNRRLHRLPSRAWKGRVSGRHRGPEHYSYVSLEKSKEKYKCNLRSVDSETRR